MEQPQPPLQIPVDFEPERRGTQFRAHVPDAIALDVAENVLLADELSDLLSDPPLRLDAADLKYPHNSVGPDDVRDAIAGLLNESWGLAADYALRGAHVLCTPGASAALYLHAKARLRPGDTVIIPSPYWPMFDRIYGQQFGLDIARMPIRHDATSSVDLAALQALHARLRAQGKRPRLLLLTSPHNPLGIVETETSLERVFAWVLAHTEMDVISDEIYAHSVFAPGARFAAALGLAPALRHRDRVHAVWGFAKDFGLSGWMAGVLLTRSSALADDITRRHARFSPFDGLKGRVFRRFLCEPASRGATPETLLRLLSSRLGEAHRCAVAALDDARLPFRSAAQGAPFLWLDLRGFLDADLDHAPHPASCVLDGPETVGLDAREGRLQRYLACTSGTVLLRGQVMHADAPGYFRLCFTAEPTARVVTAIERMGEVLRALPRPRAV